MASPRPDDELLQLLYRGGELLSGGNPLEARPYLERALELGPKNEKAQNLLGLAYFKLGILDRAAIIYEALVRENPTDPTLRVNLGLVYLKTQLLGQAVREFEVATDLSPDHGKAHNYLGLTLAQMGEYARAREHFLLAGSDAMAEKMTRALEGEVASAKAAAVPPSPTIVPPTLTLVPPPPAPVHAVPPPPPAQKIRIEVMSEEEAQSQSANAEELEVVDPTNTGGSDWGDAVEPASSQAVEGTGEEELRFAEDEGPTGPPPSAATELVDRLEVPEKPFDPDRTLTFGLPDPSDWRTQALAEVRTERRRESFALDEHPEALPPLDPEPLVTEELEPPLAPVSEAEAEVLPPDEETFAFPASSPAVVRSGPSLVAHLREVAPSLYADAPRLGGGFVVGSELAMLPVQGEMCARLGELVASVGALEIRPSFRRVRGRVTTEPLGGEASPFSRVSGVGRLWLWARGRGCVATRLADESLYVREERLIAFEDSVTYENGRIPNANGADLPLIHLAGKGKVLLAVEGTLRSVEVLGDVPLFVALEHWVGWYGKLTPKVLAPSNGHGRSVELTGEGVVLLRLPALE